MISAVARAGPMHRRRAPCAASRQRRRRRPGCAAVPRPCGGLRPKGLSRSTLRISSIGSGPVIGPVGPGRRCCAGRAGARRRQAVARAACRIRQTRAMPSGLPLHGETVRPKASASAEPGAIYLHDGHLACEQLAREQQIGVSAGRVEPEDGGCRPFAAGDPPKDIHTSLRDTGVGWVSAQNRSRSAWAAAALWPRRPWTRSVANSASEAIHGPCPGGTRSGRSRRARCALGNPTICGTSPHFIDGDIVQPD